MQYASHPTQTEQTQATILIVEDNPDDLRTLAGVIGDEAKILFASTGQQGLDMAHKHKPDLIMLDIELPDIPGPNVFKQLQQEGETAVMFVTSHHGGLHQIAAMASGAVDFISKPYEPEAIRKSVRAQLQARTNQKNLQKGIIDTLTHTYTRTHFDELLNTRWQAALAKHTPLAMALVQLDQFTQLNEAWGTLRSDACLKKIANALDIWISKPEDCLARFGHDKFALLINKANREDMPRWGHELVQTVSNLDIPHVTKLDVVTASVGIAYAVPNQINSPGSFIESAYEALSEAREAGHNDYTIVSI